MSASVFLVAVTLYFSLLLLVSYYTGKNADSNAFYIGNKKSAWYLVAFGMIGDSLSGVTFISLPGTIAGAKFSYLQLVLGYVLGYMIIARVLLPLYYRLNLTSIYSYLNERFGNNTQKTGSFFFLLSRIVGAALRLFLAAGVIQIFFFDRWHIPFWISVSIIIVLMLIYTYRGGIKTLVWTDALQSLFLLGGVIFSIVAILNSLEWTPLTAIQKISESEMSQVFFWDWREKSFFFKQFLSGAFIAVVMTGLDQNMMQKSLSCPRLEDAQKNIYWFSGVLVIVNVFFVCLGALLYLYVQEKGITLPVDAVTGKIITDKVFPALAFNHLGVFSATVFIIGLTAATFSSADSVLTTLTTSFCYDMLGLHENKTYSEQKKTRIRHAVQIGFAFVLLITILAGNLLNKTSVLDAIFTVAAYTYGPLLGLFAFGLFTNYRVRDKWVPFMCVLPPVLCYFLNENAAEWFNGYKFGYELLLINGILTFLGLWLLRKGTTETLKTA
jgi:Na+/proline symporter